ncbi:MAG TPA: glycosyltransferase family 4 protein [Gemmataceae bacterium]|nr:glycosyltransferase family 4 protein [Gemmataceae bacterium]
MTTLVHITTVPVSLWSFLGGQIGYMKDRGFAVRALASPGEYLDRFAEREEVPVHGVPMLRRITPLRDLVAVGRLWRVLRRVRPAIVHAHTPKGGLLGMIAACLTGVPVCIYQVHGMPWMTARGLKRALLSWTEWAACRLADQVLCVSGSVREAAVAGGICPPAKIKVLAAGSVNGVDAEARFNPDVAVPAHRDRTRDRLGIPRSAPVVGFVGRLVRDKGIGELATAWQTLRRLFPALHLLLVGPFEPQDPVPPEVRALLENDPRVRLIGQVDDCLPFYAAMDLVVLPTYREGLPLVPLEAAAMSLPVVATRVPGCVDAVVDGVTGTLVPPRESAALAEAITAYVRDPELRRRHGRAGRERVLRDFRPEAVWEALYEEYVRLLRRKGLPVPSPREPAAEEAEACVS